jgi:hypothetical protein
MKIKNLCALGLILSLSSCATMFGDSNDQINVRSDYKDAKLSINGNPVGKGQASYTLPRGDDALITASKKGCSDTTVPTSKKIVGAAFLNILFWPGFVVDAATGKLQKADPKDYKVNPMCN